MKESKYVVRGTPIVPSLCSIGMAILWYLYFSFTDGEWDVIMSSFSFSEMDGFQIYLSLLGLAVPLLYFLGVLFLAEQNLRWMILPLLSPIVEQVSLFVRYLRDDQSEYVFTNPMQFIAPFVALILFVFTVEKVIPNKWIFVGFCGIAVLLPLILTLCRVGEFTFSQVGINSAYQRTTITTYFWSDLLSFVLYYLGLGALALQMRPPREGDFVSLKELKAAYAEKMATQTPAAEEEGQEKTEELSQEEDQEKTEELSREEALEKTEELSQKEASEPMGEEASESE